MASSACSAELDGTAATVSSVAGFTTVNADMPVPLSSRAVPPGYSRSKPRCSSQSVTAASNAAISTRAALA